MVFNQFYCLVPRSSYRSLVDVVYRTHSLVSLMSTSICVLAEKDDLCPAHTRTWKIKISKEVGLQCICSINYHALTKYHEARRSRVSNSQHVCFGNVIQKFHPPEVFSKFLPHQRILNNILHSYPRFVSTPHN